MLKIGYGCPDDICFYIDDEFEEEFELDWLDNDVCKRILKEIDHCTWNGSSLVDNRMGYLFSIWDVSTGSKALMMAEMLENFEFWGTALGDNCTNILLEIAERKDITIFLEHLLHFDKDKFSGYSLTNNRMYKNYDDYILEICKEVPNWK